MGTIFVHQLHDHLKSLRFQIGLLILLVFFCINGLVFFWKIERTAIEMDRVNKGNEDRYQRVETVSQAVNNWYRVTNPPLETEFMVEAGADLLNTSAWICPATGWIPEDSIGMTRNMLMESFDVVDWTMIVRFVLSFLCIVLAYDTVSRELELGTLRMVLANSLSRADFLAGKFLAHLTILLVSMLLGSLLSLLFLSLNEVFDLNARLWQDYGMFLLGTLLYLSLFLFLAIGISALTRHSSSSIVLLVLIWAVLVIIIPQASSIIGVQAVEVPYSSGYKAQEFMDEVRENLEKEGIVMRGREEGKHDHYAKEKRYAQRLREAEKEQKQIARNLDEQLKHQYQVAKAVNLISPGYAFQYTIEAFLGAGVLRRDQTMVLVWQYRDSLHEFLRIRDADDPDSPHILFFPEYLSNKPLDPAHIPRLALKRISLAEGVAAGVVPIVILVLETGASFFFALWAFNRAEIAG